MENSEQHTTSTGIRDIQARKVLTSSGISGELSSSIHLLNDFCADVRRFSYTKLAALRLRGLLLNINVPRQELTLVVGSETDYQTLVEQLVPEKRLHQLLSIHFKKVQVGFGLQGEPADKSIMLEKIILESDTNPDDLRDMADIGARFRRALNVAMQGHVGVLRLHGDKDAEHLRSLWERGRITMLIEKYNISTANDTDRRLIKLWKPRNPDESNNEEVVIFID